MPNYQEGKIYKIYNTINDDIYVGSTTRKLSERMAEHRRRITNVREQNYLIYMAFREHGVDNFYIELIEKCPCNDREELMKTEGKYIRSLKPSLNKAIAGRTRKEYQEDNREHIKEYTKLWKEDNKEHIKEFIKEQHKKYRENNKEVIKERNKQYRENNKEHINSYYGEKIKCECGCIVVRGGLPRHLKSVKHQKLMNE